MGLDNIFMPSCPLDPKKRGVIKKFFKTLPCGTFFERSS